MRVSFGRCIGEGERRQSQTGAEHVADRWSGRAWFASFFSRRELFPKNRAQRAVFHSYFHGRDPFIEGSQHAARCRNRFRMAQPRAPFLRLFSRRGCSPRSGLHLCTAVCRIFICFFFPPPCYISSKRDSRPARDDQSANSQECILRARDGGGESSAVAANQL